MKKYKKTDETDGLQIRDDTPRLPWLISLLGTRFKTFNQITNLGFFEIPYFKTDLLPFGGFVDCIFLNMKRLDSTGI